ncbi:hypothetical protein LAV_00018 [Sphingobium phage Lacusarx]|uniref:Uncharacterized protein n=1 Tax=Sphingobium phage Lacusarx TaxID=1980139 RepID=A0A1W6DWX5_9CAUD|nr:hypothetical protein FDH44_gp018 [Sphingobium phage Lacusarx]ARK07418.1 hypothetical protein LAV_00018 [Sphingobium phage Lacusarx]
MAGPIPFTYTDIKSYCELKGIYSLSERERLLRFIDALDREWMKNAYEEQERRTKAPASSPLPGTGNAPRRPRTPPRKG